MSKQKQLKLQSSEGQCNNNSITIRSLKIQYGSYNSRNYSRHPVIRIAGNYLREFGFKIGDTIELKLSQGRIEITRLGQE